jgi:hypothetical protein
VCTQAHKQACAHTHTHTHTHTHASAHVQDKQKNVSPKFGIGCCTQKQWKKPVQTCVQNNHISELWTFWILEYLRATVCLAYHFLFSEALTYKMHQTHITAQAFILFYYWIHLILMGGIKDRGYPNMYYDIHEDVNSGSHIGSLLSCYLHRLIKCPHRLICWFHIRALDMTVLNSCIWAFSMCVFLKRRKPSKVFINKSRSMININYTTHSLWNIITTHSS